MNTLFKKQRTTSRNQSGFTLIEMLIVVIVLGVLAMIIIPQISVSTDEAKLSTLQRNLGSLRGVIEHYYHQHGAYPGAKKTDGSGQDLASAVQSAEAFVDQLTKYTEASGKTAGDSTTLTAPIYGPYLKTTTLPTNPYNAKNGVTCDTTTTDITTRAAVPGDGTGWKFYVKTGVLIANDSLQHQDF